MIFNDLMPFNLKKTKKVANSQLFLFCFAYFSIFGLYFGYRHFINKRRSFMTQIIWTSSVGVHQEENKNELTTIKVPNSIYEQAIKGKWLSDSLYSALSKNNFKLLLVNDNGEARAIRTFGTRFALFIGTPENVAS
jgi:hypothetical protein